MRFAFIEFSTIAEAQRVRTLLCLCLLGS